MAQISRRNLVKALASAPLAPVLGGQAPAPSTRSGWRVGSTAERLRAKPYRKRLCRVENYPSCLTPTDTPIGVTVEEYADLIDDAGALGARHQFATLLKGKAERFLDEDVRSLLATVRVHFPYVYVFAFHNTLDYDRDMVLGASDEPVRAGVPRPPFRSHFTA